MSSAFKILFFIFISLGLPTSLAANIINEGSETVSLRLEQKDGGAYTTLLYPGQKIVMPSDITAVTANPIVSKRGDENVNVKVISGDGTEDIITSFGSRVVIGLGLEENIENISMSVKNLSNIIVIVVFEKQKGFPVKRKLYPNETYDIPRGAVRVRVEQESKFWGDEAVDVEITLADGSTENITRIGGYFNLVSEESTVNISDSFQ